MLSAGEGTNRQAFAQNKRIMATTPGRILTDPLFRKVPYDLLIVDDAPRIPTPLLLAASGLIRERIILSGNTNDLLLGGQVSRKITNKLGFPISAFPLARRSATARKRGDELRERLHLQHMSSLSDN
jgi:hypothetical protein